MQYCNLRSCVTFVGKNYLQYFFKHAHFTASNMVKCLSGFNNSTNWILPCFNINQPIGKLVLEIVAFSPPVAFHVRSGTKFFQAASRTGQRLSTTDSSNSML